MSEPTFVQTELVAIASEELQKATDEDLKIPDPEDKNIALAQLSGVIN